jgi:hypothetical protein
MIPVKPNFGLNADRQLRIYRKKLVSEMAATPRKENKLSGWKTKAYNHEKSIEIIA